MDDQFAIASVTKSVIAAQVMQMVEAGELALNDPAADHLPLDLDFDTNGTTIRQLLGQRSGIPDYYPAVRETLSTADVLCHCGTATSSSPRSTTLGVWLQSPRRHHD